MAEAHLFSPDGLAAPRFSAGQIVIGWLLKVSLALVIVGLLLFEVVGVLVARGTAADTASKAASEAGFRYRDTANVEQAKAVAKQYAEREGATFISLSVDPQDREITVTVQKKARTLFIHRIGALRKYTIATETQTTPLPS